ncbi:MAG TPA: hypothetical protein VFZ53_31055 [Polyangiaceae bacterium]
MDAAVTGPPRAASRLVAWWGVLGVALLLAQALVRLAIVAADPFVSGRGLTPFESAVCVAWVLVSLHSEGYRGFQKAFVPRTVARAFHLASAPKPLLVALAPAFCMGLVHARPRRLVTSWSIVVLIVLAVVLVRQLPAPWRSIVDLGVVAGLLWGMIALAVSFARALRGQVPVYPLDLPE